MEETTQSTDNEEATEEVRKEYINNLVNTFFNVMENTPIKNKLLDIGSTGTAISIILARYLLLTELEGRSKEEILNLVIIGIQEQIHMLEAMVGKICHKDY